jgi:hypothetical protein
MGLVLVETVPARSFVVVPAAPLMITAAELADAERPESAVVQPAPKHDGPFANSDQLLFVACSGASNCVFRAM